MAKRAKPPTDGEDVALKKRGRKPKAAEPRQEFTPEQEAEARDRALTALSRWRTQQSAARSAKKAVDVECETIRKITGLSKKTVFAGLLATERDTAELDAEMRETNHVLRWFGLPVGTQLGLFGDGETVAAKVDADSGAADIADTPANVKRAKKEGREAGAGNVDLARGNPFAEGTKCHEAFRAGWTEAQAELASRFKPAHPEDAQPALN